MSTSPAVFISYRRDDSAGHTGRLSDTLTKRLGDGQIFMDLDGIRPGADFLERIDKTLAACQAMLVVIGRRWLTASRAGARRLDDPHDVVRREIATALERGLEIIPVLVDGAAMPHADELPADLSPLASRNAIEITDSRWSYDCDRLWRAIRQAAGHEEEATVPGLPAPRTTVIGREDELDSVEALLHDESVRVLTVTGPGGMGKTTVALAVANRIGRTDRRVVFCDLTTIERSADVIPALGEAADWEAGVEGDPVTGLASALQQSDTLLVLDNFEHVIEGAAEVGKLLDAAPGVQLLATSRIPLRLAGEREFPLTALDLPAPGSDLGEISKGGAVRLFVERAVSARSGFKLDAGNAGPVVEICRQLDGLPLAIELAAARIRILEPDRLLERLDQRLRLLNSR